MSTFTSITKIIKQSLKTQKRRLTQFRNKLTFNIGHLEISASASRHQHRYWRRHRHCNFFFPFSALFFTFRSFLWNKTFMVKSFSNFCRDVASACFWRKELRHGCYLRSFKNTQGWKLQLVCLCISDKEPY